jgi:type I restriction enzyme S subunit
VRRVRVGDVLQLQRRAVSIDPATEYRLIGVYSFGKGIFHREPKIGAELGNYKFFAVEPGDLVVSNIQAWEGAIGFATEADGGTVGTHRFLAYTAIDPDEIDANWARYFFLSEAGFPLIQKAAPGSVTRNRTLAVERFEALEIPLPDIDEQRRIAAQLDRVTRLTTRLNIIRRRSASFDAWLDAQLDRRKVELAREHRSLPLAELAEWSSGGTPRAGDPTLYGGGIPWAVIGDLNDGTVVSTERTITESGLSHSSAKLLPAGAVLVAMYGSIGKLGVAGIPLATNQAIAAAVPTQVTGDYLLAALRAARRTLVSLGKGGAQQNISQTVLKGVQIPVPPPQAQKDFADGVGEILAKYYRLGALESSASSIGDALVPSSLNSAFVGLA